MPRGSLRQLTEEFFTGRSYAESAFERIKQVNGERDKEKMDNFKRSLKKITGAELFRSGTTETRTPLYDVIQLISEGCLERADSDE